MLLRIPLWRLVKSTSERRRKSPFSPLRTRTLVVIAILLFCFIHTAVKRRLHAPVQPSPVLAPLYVLPQNGPQPPPTPPRSRNRIAEWAGYVEANRTQRATKFPFSNTRTPPVLIPDSYTVVLNPSTSLSARISHINAFLQHAIARDTTQTSRLDRIYEGGGVVAGYSGTFSPMVIELVREKTDVVWYVEQNVLWEEGGRNDGAVGPGSGRSRVEDSQVQEVLRSSNLLRPGRLGVVDVYVLGNAPGEANERIQVNSDEHLTVVHVPFKSSHTPEPRLAIREPGSSSYSSTHIAFNSLVSRPNALSIVSILEALDFVYEDITTWRDHFVHLDETLRGVNTKEETKTRSSWWFTHSDSESASRPGVGVEEEPQDSETKGADKRTTSGAVVIINANPGVICHTRVFGDAVERLRREGGVKVFVKDPSPSSNGASGQNAVGGGYIEYDI